MSDLSELYQEILLEHNSKPRNFRKLEEATQSAEGYNPLCGDRITLYLSLEDGMIADVAFQGTGCAISRASASMLTQSIKGQSVTKAREIFQAFHQMLTEPDEALDYEVLGDLETLSGVVAFPTRIKCAVLAWHTMQAALDDKGEAVSTE
ncbi:MAG: SUF system NifU family Fe-S cluster assembly protein [SAR202 cluster bacterium Io17-Chloro-G9]|nr:MAG: SUF system NifU family Fe-S cluster assembly protein [SAR202 cluster bacterium Io17-Chloro-G9]